MTDKQPEALRLADKYAERYHDYRMRATHETEHDLKVFRNALESELRRLHEVNAELVEALEKLARIGNGDQYGNRIGNVIAQEALRKAQGDNNARGNQ